MHFCHSPYTYHKGTVKIDFPIRGHLRGFSDLFNLIVIEKGGPRRIRGCWCDQETSQGRDQEVPPMKVKLCRGLGFAGRTNCRSKGRGQRHGDQERKNDNAHDGMSDIYLWRWIQRRARERTSSDSLSVRGPIRFRIVVVRLLIGGVQVFANPLNKKEDLMVVTQKDEGIGATIANVFVQGEGSQSKMNTN